MVSVQKSSEQGQTIKNNSLTVWQLNRLQAGKHEESVNREIMHRQFAN